MCFCKCVLLQLLVLPNGTSFVCYQIHFGKFFFLTIMATILVKEGKLVVVVDDLDFKIRDVAFETNMFNKYDTFDPIANKCMENPNYAYLHCGLLDMVTLTIITLKVKLPHIEMHEQHLQKCMFVKVDNFNIESKSKRVLRKVTCKLLL